MIVAGMAMFVVGLGMLFAMVLQLMPASLWLSLAAYAASFSGVFIAGLELAARLRR
jgi:hypothetical protein